MGSLAVEEHFHFAGCHAGLKSAAGLDLSGGLVAGAAIKTSLGAEVRFLASPLAKASGGTGKCGQPVYQDRNDPDYRAVCALVEAAVKKAWAAPRRDLPAIADVPSAPATASR